MNFYVLRNPTTAQSTTRAVTDYMPLDPIVVGNAVQCDHCGEFMTMMPWLPPHRVTLELWTSRYGDIAFGPGSEMLFTSSLVDTFLQSGLTGLRLQGPVDVSRILRRGAASVEGPSPSYVCVLPELTHTKIDLAASGVETKEPASCSECQVGVLMRHARVVVDEKTWSGEDVFYARGLSGLVITSERFAAWFDRLHVNNGALIPASEYSRRFM